MLNYIWAAIILLSFTYSLVSGRLHLFEQAITESAGNAVTFVINLMGIMAMWSGLMEIAERTGLITKFSKLLLPFTKLLFPNQKDPEVLSCIIMSFMSNIFGAGNSSTVFALRAMEKLDKQNHSRISASNDMCMFAVVNMAFAPLVPLITVNLRQELGSSEPYSIILPSLIVSISTIIISIFTCKILERRF